MKVCNLSIILPILPKHQQLWKYTNNHVINRKRRLWVLQSFGYDLKMLFFNIEMTHSFTYRYLISESTHYFMGTKRKPLYLKNNIQKLNIQIQKKILLLNADYEWNKQCKTHQKLQKWCLDYIQRNKLLKVLLKKSHNNDLAILLDTDEIPYPHVLRKIIHCSFLNNKDSIDMIRLTSVHHLYGFHCMDPKKWDHGPRLISIKFLRSNNFTFDKFYNLRLRGKYSVAGIEDAGMHLSYFGTAQDIQHKLNVWGHANIYKDPESKSISTIQKCIRNCHDIIGRDYRASFCEKTPLKNLRKTTRVNFPREVLESSFFKNTMPYV